jgi:hypothetical protein
MKMEISMQHLIYIEFDNEVELLKGKTFAMRQSEFVDFKVVSGNDGSVSVGGANQDLKEDEIVEEEEDEECDDRSCDERRARRRRALQYNQTKVDEEHE